MSSMEDNTDFYFFLISFAFLYYIVYLCNEILTVMKRNLFILFVISLSSFVIAQENYLSINHYLL